MRPVHTVELINPKELVAPKQTEITKPKPKPKPKQKPKSRTKPKKTKTPVKKTRSILKPTVPPLTTPSLEERLSKRFQKFEQTATEPKSSSFQEPSSYKPQFKTTISSTPAFPFQWYLDLIQGKIAALWHQPQMVIAKQYSSMISFTILKDGQVKDIRIKRASGMANFDKSAKQAIEQAQPLPPLPPSYKHSQLVVNVEFDLE